MIYIIDTIRLESPIISEEVAEIVEAEAIRRQGIDCKSGEVLYNITTSDLKGSYDSRLMVRVARKEWTRKNSKTVLEECDPKIVIEGSIHKLLLGHNVYGGPEDFQESCKYLIYFLEKIFNVELPNYLFWIVRRIDYAEVFKLETSKAVEEYVRILNTSTFPRRTVLRFGSQSIYVPGTSTTLKMYHKGPELWKHDKSRLRTYLSDGDLLELFELANKILRVEIEIKPQKLKYEYERLPRVLEVSTEFLKRVYNEEVRRLLKEGKKSIETVRTAWEVNKRLNQVFSSRKASNVMATWYQLTTLGEEAVRKSMERTTLWRHLKAMEQAGVDWRNTDIVKKDDNSVPNGFVPVIDSSFRWPGQHVEVSRKLQLIA